MSTRSSRRSARGNASKGGPRKRAGSPLTEETPNSKRLLRATNNSLRAGKPKSPLGGGELVSDLSSLSTDTTHLARTVEKLRAENARLKDTIQEKVPEKHSSIMAERVKRFAKHDLFHKVKFINSQKHLDEFRGPKTLGRYVMDGLNIPEERRPSFWIAYKSLILSSINQQRSNVTAAIKSAWLGK